MEIIYKIGDFPDPGDRDVFNGIQEMNKNNYSEALKHFEKGSNYDNEYALLFSAAIYYTGVGIDRREPAKAMDLCKKIVSKWNNYVAQYLMGLMYVEGDKGILMDRKAATHWFLLSAEQGWPYAIAIMGDIMVDGISSGTDIKNAIALFEKVAKKDDSETEVIKDETFYLFGNKNLLLDFTHANQKSMKVVKEKYLSRGAISPVSGLGGLLPSDPNFEEYQCIIVWDLLTEKKSSGVLACQIRLYEMYESIRQILPSKNAVYWLKMAAKNESPDACANLGNFYKEGLGVKQDYKEAAKWFLKSYNLGSSKGVHHLGMMYYKGLGFKRNCKLALFYFKLKLTLEADSFESITYYCMGEIYRLGMDGVPKDYKSAYNCYENAYRLGHAMGAVKIAGFYCLGLGVKKDQAKTIEWLRAAVSNDFYCSCAQNILSIIDEKGFEAAAKCFRTKVLNSDLCNMTEKSPFK